MEMVSVAVDPYILGTFFASLIGFVVLYFFRRSYLIPSGAQKRKSSPDGECRSAGDGSGTDVIIVGAGVAGAALAHTLGKEGRRVHVIERDLTEPDRIVGELLQPGGYLKLVELGLEDCVDEIDAQRVQGYVLFKEGKNTRLTLCYQKTITR